MIFVRKTSVLFGFLLIFPALCWGENAAPIKPCRIEVVEKGSGWPVPLVELRTTHNVRLVSDNAGVIACNLYELMGRETWFTVIGHGYEIPKDGFGISGVRLLLQPGATLRVEVTRTIIARRLGRLTGGGLFADSQLLGEQGGWKESGILGCDSVQNAVHRGRLFWLWGDTTLARYPLGIFNGTSATTDIKPLAKFEPPLKLVYDYITDDKDNPRGVADIPGEGATWITAYVSLPDKEAGEHLVGSYMKVKPPMEAYEWGLCVWNDDKAQFERLTVEWVKSQQSPERPLMPDGHPIFWTDGEGKRWLMFGNPLPAFRCPATFEAWRDKSTWEVIKSQETIPSADGNAIKPHSGSMAFNPWRKRWVTVFMQYFGSPSAFGEVWYAEADAPAGPWGPAVKVLTHDNYTFYNPRLHPEFTAEDSPILIFEGTYSRMFADRPEATPRYDYNQILYRLDLDDPSLAPAASPVAIPSNQPH